MKQKSMLTSLITPSWVIEQKKDFEDGLRSLRKLGLALRGTRYISRMPSTAAKVAQIHAAYRDPGVGMLLATRGGAGSMKLLPHLDFDLIKKNPKILAGFSDISTMLNAVFERTGQVTLHAPMVLNLSAPTEFTVKSFLNALDGFTEKNLFMDAPVTVYRPGRAEGRLKGGNLVTLTTLTGTEWEIVTDGAVVFLEDVDEKIHEIDRYLSQWILAGKFKKVKGLILGDFRGSEPRDVFKIITGQMKVNFPVVHCPFIGHVRDKITLPVGAKVRLDTARRELLVR